MMQWYKYAITGVFLILIVLWTYIYNTIQTSTLHTSADVQGILRSSMVGHPRSDGVDGGVNKDELIGNLVEDVIKNSRANKHVKIRLDYTFLDASLNPTNDNKAIDSVQFRTALYTERDNELIGVSVRRIALDMVTKRLAGEPTLTKEFYIGVLQAPDYTGDLVLPDAKKIVSMETVGSGGGTVTYTESSEFETDKTVTITLSNGNKLKLASSSGGLITSLEKEIDESYKQTSPNYSDSEGYVGTLSPSVVSGEFQPSSRKYVESHDTEAYADEDGYKGTLTKLPTNVGVKEGILNLKGVELDEDEIESVNSGNLEDITSPIPGYSVTKAEKVQTIADVNEEVLNEDGTGLSVKYIEGAVSPYYNQDGYSGTLNSNIETSTSLVTKPITITDGLIERGTIPNEYIIDNTNGDVSSEFGVLYLKDLQYSSSTKKVQGLTEVSEVVENTPSAINSTKPTEQVTNKGQWVIKNKYTATRYTDIGFTTDIYDEKAEDGSELPDEELEEDNDLDENSADGADEETPDTEQETVETDNSDLGAIGDNSDGEDSGSDDSSNSLDVNVDGNKYTLKLLPGLTKTDDLIQADSTYKNYNTLLSSKQSLLFADTTTSSENQSNFEKYASITNNKGYSFVGYSDLASFKESENGEFYIKLPSSKKEEVAVVEWVWEAEVPVSVTAVYEGMKTESKITYSGYVTKGMESATSEQLEGITYADNMYNLTLTKNASEDVQYYSGWVERPRVDTRVIYYVGTAVKNLATPIAGEVEGYGYRVRVKYEPDGITGRENGDGGE